MNADGKDSLDTVLQYVRKNRKICRIETYRDSGMSGFVKHKYNDVNHETMGKVLEFYSKAWEKRFV